MPDCSFLASDIQTCQSKGKIVTLSLGGATGAAGFSSDAQASSFADTLWNLYLGGSSSTRPFGSAVLDGYDFFVADVDLSHDIYIAELIWTLKAEAQHTLMCLSTNLGAT